MAALSRDMCFASTRQLNVSTPFHLLPRHVEGRSSVNRSRSKPTALSDPLGENGLVRRGGSEQGHRRPEFEPVGEAEDFLDPATFEAAHQPRAIAQPVLFGHRRAGNAAVADLLGANEVN